MTRTLHLCSWNSYLVPPVLIQSTHPTYFSADYSMRERAMRIIKYLKDGEFDVCQLQEAWGTESQTFHELLNHTHSVYPEQTPWKYSNLIPQWIREPVNWLYAFYQQYGGLMTVIRRQSNIRTCWHHHHTFTQSATSSRKGCRLSLLDCSELWQSNDRKEYLLLVNTHLDSKDGFKAAQLKEIAECIQQTIRERILPKCDANYVFADDDNASDRKDLSESDSTREISLVNLAIVLCGDFNLKASDKDSYGLLQSLGDSGIVQLRDLNTDASDSWTFDPTNNSMAIDHESGGRIDYILAVDSLKVSSNITCHFQRLQATDFQIHCADLKASDHYPLSVRLLLE